MYIPNNIMVTLQLYNVFVSIDKNGDSMQI